MSSNFNRLDGNSRNLFQGLNPDENSSPLKRKREKKAQSSAFDKKARPNTASKIDELPKPLGNTPPARSPLSAPGSMVRPDFPSERSNRFKKNSLHILQTPPTPRKSSSNEHSQKYKGYEMNHFINPPLKTRLGLTALQGDGKYKTAYLINGQPDKIALLMDKPEHNVSVNVIYGHMENTLNQYRDVRNKFGQDKCVTFDNEATAIRDGGIIANNINLSLEAVLAGLIDHFGEPLDSMDQINDQNIKHTHALDILLQIKDFYDSSILHEIDTDIHLGNFRVIRDSNTNDYKVLLTDFREAITEGDLMVNKRTEIRDLKNDLSALFTDNFIDAFFRDTIEGLNENDNSDSDLGLEFDSDVESDGSNELGAIDFSSFLSKDLS